MFESARSPAGDPSHRRPEHAYHEAGHVLARLVLGHQIEKVVVRTIAEMKQPYVDGCGRIEHIAGIVEAYGLSNFLLICGNMEEVRKQFAANPRFVPLTRIWAEQDLIISMAGPIAEMHYCEGWPACGGGEHTWEYSFAFMDGGESDEEYIEKVLSALTDSKRRQNTILCKAERRAEILVRSERGWSFIERLATRLLADGTLDHDECSDIFAEVFDRGVPSFDAWSKQWPPKAEQLHAGWLPLEKQRRRRPTIVTRNTSPQRIDLYEGRTQSGTADL